MKVTDFSRSTIGTILGTTSDSLAIDGVTVANAAASNYHLVALTSNTAQWQTHSADTIAAGTYFLATSGGQGVYASLGNLGATETINLANGLFQAGTLNANCTIGFTGWTNGVLCEVGVRLTEDGTGGWTPTFTGVTWPSGAVPTHTTTAGAVTEYLFWSTDGGAKIYGGQIGGSSFVLSHPSTSSNSFTSNTVLTNDASIAITMPTFGTLHLSAPFFSEVVTDAGAIVWHGDDVVHDLVRLY